MSERSRPSRSLTFVVGASLLTLPVLTGGCDDKGTDNPPTSNPAPQPEPTPNTAMEPEPEPEPEPIVNEGPEPDETPPEPSPTANPGPMPDE